MRSTLSITSFDQPSPISSSALPLTDAPSADAGVLLLAACLVPLLLATVGFATGFTIFAGGFAAGSVLPVGLGMAELSAAGLSFLLLAARLSALTCLPLGRIAMVYPMLLLL